MRRHGQQKFDGARVAAYTYKRFAPGVCPMLCQHLLPIVIRVAQGVRIVIDKT
jgi:hypothetical protein